MGFRTFIVISKESLEGGFNSSPMPSMVLECAFFSSQCSHLRMRCGTTVGAATCLWQGSDERRCCGTNQIKGDVES